MKDRIIKMLEVRAGLNGLVHLVAGLLIGAALLTLLSVVGAMQKVDNDNAVKEYCKGVHEGIHPDYNGSYQRQCLNGEPKND